MPTIINGTTGVSQVQDSVVSDTKLSLTANSASIKTALNASGNAPIYACRAWVNFNGTGTVAIRASGNVSSITDNGTGDYTVNFTTAMLTGDLCALGNAGNNTSSLADSAVNFFGFSTTSVSMQIYNMGGSAVDRDNCCVAIFR